MGSLQRKMLCTAAALSIAAFAGTALAEDADAKAEEEEKGTTVLSPQWRSIYLVPKGVRRYDGPVLQTDLTHTFPSGLRLGLWWSTSLDNASLAGDYGDEMDYTIGWFGKTGNTSLGFGLAYLDFIDWMSTGGGGDTFMAYGDLSHKAVASDHATFIPYARAEWRVPVDMPEGANAGAHLFFGSSMLARPEKDAPFAVMLKASGLYDTGTYAGFDHGFLGIGEAGLEWHFSKKAVMNLPTFKLVKPLTVNDARKEESSVGAGMTLTF